MLREDPRLASVCAARGAGLVLMHSRGDVPTMATYEHATLRGRRGGRGPKRIGLADCAGASGRRRRSIDRYRPGHRLLEANDRIRLAVLGELPRIVALGYPVLVGVSRKRFIGEITGVKVAANRVYGTLGANVAALALGARLFRVHDVGAAREALDTAWEILRRRPADRGRHTPGAV